MAQYKKYYKFIALILLIILISFYPLFAENRIGVINKYALSFDGVDDYVLIADSSSLNPQGPFTIFIWMKSNTNYVGTNGPVFIDKRGGAASGYAIYNWGSGFVISVFLSGNRYYNIFPIDWNVLQWHQYVAVWDGTNTILYIDAVLKGSKPATGTMGVNTLPLYIGIYQGVSYPFNGLISRILIYSRALNQIEIQWNYNNPDDPVRNGLVLWLFAHPDYVRDIDGDGINEWIDLSGNNNNGKIYGAKLVIYESITITLLTRTITTITTTSVEPSIIQSYDWTNAVMIAIPLVFGFLFFFLSRKLVLLGIGLGLLLLWLFFGFHFGWALLGMFLIFLNILFLKKAEI
jgi:hypothetical protein